MKISKRVHEEAAYYLSLSASNGYINGADIDAEVCLEAKQLGDAAWKYIWRVGDQSWDYPHDWAEAEALVREGWSP